MGAAAFDDDDAQDCAPSEPAGIDDPTPPQPVPAANPELPNPDVSGCSAAVSLLRAVLVHLRFVVSRRSVVAAAERLCRDAVSSPSPLTAAAFAVPPSRLCAAAGLGWVVGVIALAVGSAPVATAAVVLHVTAMSLLLLRWRAEQFQEIYGDSGD